MSDTAPTAPTAPRPRRVVPLVVTAGEAGGPRLDLLSAEVWDGWWDLRFARVATSPDAPPLPRRVPPDASWSVTDDRGSAYEVVECVGRGDRGFSNGEVRLRPALADDATAITVEVDLGARGPQPSTIRYTVPLVST